MCLFFVLFLISPWKYGGTYQMGLASVKYIPEQASKLFINIGTRKFSY